MSNVISSGWDTSFYFLHVGFSDTITSSFASPEADASGLACDGTNLISATVTSNFRHIGFSSSIGTSYLYAALDITWDGTNAITTGGTANKHVRHVGFSLGVESSISTPGGNSESVTWDGTNLLCTDGVTFKHYLHSGFTTTITDSYFSTAAKLAWDGVDVISSNVYSGRHLKHVGFSPTISESYLAPDALPYGIAWGDPQLTRVPGNVLSVDIGEDRIYRHVSFSEHIESSYTTPGPSPSGITWDTLEDVLILSHVQTTDTTTQKHYRYDGFSDSVVASYSSPGTNPVGISWLEWLFEGNWYGLGVSIDADTCKVYLHQGFSATVSDCYNTPGPAPRDLVYDESPSVITSDAFYDKYYQHLGFSETVNTSYSSPSSSPYGITWTGTYDAVYLQTDVISADNDANRHYRHWGLTATIANSYTSPGDDPAGISFDGRYPLTLPYPPPANVISADSVNKEFYWHVGFSASIAARITAPGDEPTGVGSTGIDWGEGGGDDHIMSVDRLEDKHYLHVQFSETITDSYTSPNDYPTGIAWDGSSVISAGHGTLDKHYQHDGFSDTITNSYVSPDVQPSGIEWHLYDDDVISADYSAMKHYWHVDFSASLRTSYSSPSGYPTGIAVHTGLNTISADSTEVHFLHVGFSASIAASYTSPGPWPYGMTWAAGDPFWPVPPVPDPDPPPILTLLSVDRSENKHYLHGTSTGDIFQGAILESYAAPSVTPWGITTDHQFNVLSTTDGKYWKHHWFSSTITDSFSVSPSTCRGLSWDLVYGTLIGTRTNNFFRHDGFSSSIIDSFVKGYAVRGVGAGDNMLSVRDYSHSFRYLNRHYLHASTFSSTLIESYTTDTGSYAPGSRPKGIGWLHYEMSSHVISSNLFNTGTHFLHDGFSATILDCHLSPGPFPTGIEWGTTKRVAPPAEYEILLEGFTYLSGEVFKKTSVLREGAITFVGTVSRTVKFLRSILEGAITFIGTLTTVHDQLGNERRITQVLVEVDQDVAEERRATQLVLEVDLEEEPASIAPIDLDDYLAYMDIDSLEITEGLGPYGDTCFFTVTIPNALIPDTIGKPKSGSPVVIILYSVVYFKGIIGTVTEEPVNPDITRYSCDCTDFTRWLDRKLILADRPEELAGERIEALVDWIGTYLSGFPFDDFTYVSDGFDVEAASYDYITLSSILDEVAEACHYQWYVDFEKKIHFFDLEESVSPLDTDYGNLLDLDDPGNLDIGGIVINEDVTQLKNRVYIKGYAERSDIKYPDGPYPQVENQSFYKLYQEPWDWESTEVAVSGEDVLEGLERGTRVVSLDPLDGADETLIGQDGAAYICIFNMGVRFPSTDLPEGHFTVWYYPALPDRVSTYEDIYSIEFMANREGSSGVHEFLVSAPHLRVETVERVGAIGEYLLRRYAWPYRSGSFTTLTFPHVPERLGLPDWHPGQYFRLVSSSRDIYDYEIYWKSGQTNKSAITMYVLKVTRTFAEARDEIGGTTLMVKEVIEFANQPYPL